MAQYRGFYSLLHRRFTCEGLGMGHLDQEKGSVGLPFSLLFDIMMMEEDYAYSQTINGRGESC